MNVKSRPLIAALGMIAGIAVMQTTHSATPQAGHVVELPGKLVVTDNQKLAGDLVTLDDSPLDVTEGALDNHPVLEPELEDAL